IREGMKLLDVGSGIGKGIRAFRNLGIDCYGLEPSSQFYQYAIEKMKVDPAHLQLTSVYEANFPSGNFDFINCSAVLEHLSDPDSAIKKMLDWLRPGGFIYISVPYAGWLMSRMLNSYYRVTATDYVTNLSPLHSPFHLYEFGVKSFSENARKNGYEFYHYEHSICE